MATCWGGWARLGEKNLPLYAGWRLLLIMRLRCVAGRDRLSSFVRSLYPSFVRS